MWSLRTGDRDGEVRKLIPSRDLKLESANLTHCFTTNSDHLFELNYAIMLFNHDDIDNAKLHFMRFEKLFSELDDASRMADQTVLDMRSRMIHLLGLTKSQSND